jgi:hypothetical protein
MNSQNLIGILFSGIMKIVVTLKLINFSRSRLFLIIKKKYNIMARIVGGDILIFDDFVIKFGYMLRTGFEFGLFRFGLEYNGVGFGVARHSLHRWAYSSGYCSSDCKRLVFVGLTVNRD